MNVERLKINACWDYTPVVWPFHRLLQRKQSFSAHQDAAPAGQFVAIAAAGVGRAVRWQAEEGEGAVLQVEKGEDAPPEGGLGGGAVEVDRGDVPG